MLRRAVALAMAYVFAIGRLPLRHLPWCLGEALAIGAAFAVAFAVELYRILWYGDHCSVFCKAVTVTLAGHLLRCCWKERRRVGVPLCADISP